MLHWLVQSNTAAGRPWRSKASVAVHMAPVDAAATVTATSTVLQTRLDPAVALQQAASGMEDDGSGSGAGAGGGLMVAAEVDEAPFDAPVKGVAGALKNFEGLALLGGLPLAFFSARAFQTKQREVEEQVRSVRVFPCRRPTDRSRG